MPIAAFPLFLFAEYLVGGALARFGCSTCDMYDRLTVVEGGGRGGPSKGGSSKDWPDREGFFCCSDNTGTQHTSYNIIIMTTSGNAGTQHTSYNIWQQDDNIIIMATLVHNTHAWQHDNNIGHQATGI